jgi:hypothetical protein
LIRLIWLSEPFAPAALPAAISRGVCVQLKDGVHQVFSSFAALDLWTILGAIPAFAFGVYLVHRTLRYIRLKLPILAKRPRSARKQILLFYQRMLHIFARKGMPKHAAVTPGEFACMIDHQYPDYSRDVQYITDLILCCSLRSTSITARRTAQRRKQAA